mgnify:CR=1 FL=1
MMMQRSHWQMQSKTLFRSKDDLSKKITQIADDTKADPSDFLAGQFFYIYMEEPFTD